MNTEKVLADLKVLDELANQIMKSQKFGQPVPPDTTRNWGVNLKLSINSIRAEVSGETEPAAWRTVATQA